jgi:hypothetical protein
MRHALCNDEGEREKKQGQANKKISTETVMRESKLVLCAKNGLKIKQGKKEENFLIGHTEGKCFVRIPQTFYLLSSFACTRTGFSNKFYKYQFTCYRVLVEIIERDSCETKSQ